MLRNLLLSGIGTHYWHLKADSRQYLASGITISMLWQMYREIIKFIIRVGFDFKIRLATLLPTYLNC
jgi:hypothetical protein